MALKYIKKKDINLKFTSCKVKISDRLPYRALLNDLEQGLIDLAVVEYEKLLDSARRLAYTNFEKLIITYLILHKGVKSNDIR